MFGYNSNLNVAAQTEGKARFWTLYSGFPLNATTRQKKKKSQNIKATPVIPSLFMMRGRDTEAPCEKFRLGSKDNGLKFCHQ